MAPLDAVMVVPNAFPPAAAVAVGVAANEEGFEVAVELPQAVAIIMATPTTRTTEVARPVRTVFPPQHRSKAQLYTGSRGIPSHRRPRHRLDTLHKPTATECAVMETRRRPRSVAALSWWASLNEQPPPQRPSPPLAVTLGLSTLVAVAALLAWRARS